jgi:very-short-patch-repair endonuclease
MRSYTGQPSGTVPRARALRRDATEAEKVLWRGLRALSGTKWRRQVPVGPYFADFLCFGAKLIVEADGGQHADAAEYDARRTRFLEAQGYRVIRFWNNDVLANLNGVLEQISLSLGEREGGAKRRESEGDELSRPISPSPSQPLAGPLPLPKGEGLKALALGTLAVIATPATAAPDPALATQLQQRTQMLADAVAKGDKAAWDAALDPAVIYVTEGNEVKTKAQFLAGLAPLPEELSGQIRVGDFKLNREGPVAVASYTNYENLDYFGQLVRTRYKVTDTWMLKGNAWVLIASQSGAILDDPPAVALPAEKLADYSGQYELTLTTHYRVGVVAGRLIGQRQGGKYVELKAEAPDVFFTVGNPRSRKIFLRDAAGKVTGFVDRREGHDILWKRIQ